MKETLFYFDIDKFLLFYSRKNKEIRTSHLSKWVGCSLRHVQKWAKKNGIPFKWDHKTKFYIWDENAVRQFVHFINRKYDKKDAIRKMREQRRKENEEYSKKRSEENEKLNERLREEEKKRTKFATWEVLKKLSYPIKDYHRLHKLQKWAKENGVPLEYSGGRKNYIWTNELIEEIKNKKLLK